MPIGLVCWMIKVGNYRDLQAIFTKLRGGLLISDQTPNCN